MRLHYFLFRCHESYKFLLNVVFLFIAVYHKSINLSLLLLLVDKSFRLSSFNVWALCPTGYYLNGLRLSAGTPAYLQHIDEGQCCHPQGHPNTYEHCYDQDVTYSFENKGWSECQQARYYMTGFYKSSCDNIYCIEKFRCCKMKKRNFYFLDLHT